MRRLLLLAVVTLVAVPTFAFAAGLFEGPLVACPSAPFCQLCDLMKTLNNVIKFAVSFSVVIATLMFAYAGILYVTASAKQDNIKKAHGIFTKVFMGLVIILISWLVIDIVMKTFLSGSFGPWNDIQCGKWPASIVLEANGLGVQNPNDVAFLDTPQQPFDGPGGQCVAQSQQLAQSYKPPAGSHTCDPSHFVQSQASFKGTIANIRADPSILSAIKYCAVKEGVSESDIVALMVQESGGNRAARDGGTYGLMQLGPNDAKNDNPSLRGMSNEDIITLLKNEKKDPAWDKISVCTGAARIKRLQNQYNTDPRKAIAAYNTTGGLAPSPICIGKMVLECPIMSDADIKRCGDKLNWSGNRARTQTCFTSCEVTCARLDNFETIKGLWTGG